MNNSKKIIIAIVIFVIGFSGLAFSFKNYISAYKNKPKEKTQVHKTEDERKKIKDEIYNQYISAIEDLRKCESDDDCAPVPDGVCGCGGGGKNTAVNKNFVDRAKGLHDGIYYGTGCVAMMSDDISCISPPICKDSRCAIDTDSPEVCEKSRDVNRCYYEFALYKKDINLCDKLQTEKINFSHQSCITNLAQSLDQISVCDELENEQRTACKDDYYYRKSHKIGENFNVCFMIVEIKKQQECLFSGILRSKDADNCKFIIDTEEQKSCIGNILSDLARDNKDISLCKKIPDIRGESRLRNDCIEELTPKTK